MTSSKWNHFGPTSSTYKRFRILRPSGKETTWLNQYINCLEMVLNPNRGHSGGDHSSHWVGDRNAPCPDQQPLTGHTPITNLKATISPIFMD